jgi:hypothetical protein
MMAMMAMMAMIDSHRSEEKSSTGIGDLAAGSVRSIRNFVRPTA